MSHSPQTALAPRLRIRIARTEAQIQQAVTIRYRAYAERLVGLAADVALKEDLDESVDPVILLAEDAYTSRVIATARLNSGPGIREVLGQIDLPASYAHDRLGYFSRMAAVGDPIEKKMARGLLHKALLQICVAKQVDRMLLLVGDARSKLYMPWGFKPVFAEDAPLRPDMVHGRAVKLFQLESRGAEAKALELGKPLYDFLFGTYHEEIEVFSSLSSVPSRNLRVDPADSLRAIELIQESQSLPSVVAIEQRSLPTVAAIERRALPSVAAIERRLLPTVMAIERRSLPTVVAIERRSLPTVVAIERRRRHQDSRHERSTVATAPATECATS